jgi:hypothetical protein
MAESTPSLLAAWSNFYVMIGSSAAALTGLMFVVMTLVSGEKRPTSSSDGINTYSTPTVLHFCAALVIAAGLIAPWHALIVPSLLISLVGVAGAVYELCLMFRATRFGTYHPDVEDWTFFWILPFLAYGALLAAGIALPHVPAPALFVVGGSIVLLLFIGIRNSWDVVTFLAMSYPDPKE